MFKFGQRKDEFFGMFDKAAKNVHECALALLDLLEHYEDVPNKVKRIKNLEHAGDEHTHQMLARLARMFITPLDREDIQRAATRLDDVLDEMDTAANRMMLFKIGEGSARHHQVEGCLRNPGKGHRPLRGRGRRFADHRGQARMN